MSSSHQHSAHPQPARAGDNVYSPNNSTASPADTVSSASILNSNYIFEPYTDEELEKYIPMMNYQLNAEFYDVLVLSCEDDDNLVEEFCKGLKQISLRNNKPPKVIKSSHFAPRVNPKITNLEFALERCTYIFLFVTKTFVNDKWKKFSAETCLMEAINNPEKQWCVVPVFTEPKRSCSFKIPPSLNSLKGVQYRKGPDNNFDKEYVKKLLDEGLPIRLKHEDTLNKERKKWVTEYKTKEYIRKKQEEEEQKHENQIASPLSSGFINKQQHENGYPCADADHIYPIAESRKDGAVSEKQVVLQGVSSSQRYSETKCNNLDSNVSEDAAALVSDSQTMPKQKQFNQGEVPQNMHCNIPQTTCQSSVPRYKPQVSAALPQAFSQSERMVPDTDLNEILPKESETTHIHVTLNISNTECVIFGENNVASIQNREKRVNNLIQESDQSTQSVSARSEANPHTTEQPLASTTVSAVSQDNLPNDRDATYSPQTCVKISGEPVLPKMPPEALEVPAATPFRSTNNSSKPVCVIPPFNLLGEPSALKDIVASPFRSNPGLEGRRNKRRMNEASDTSCEQNGSSSVDPNFYNVPFRSCRESELQQSNSANVAELNNNDNNETDKLHNICFIM